MHYIRFFFINRFIEHEKEKDCLKNDSGERFKEDKYEL